MIESTVALADRMQALLSANGYHVRCFKISADALQEIEASKNTPYTLIISSYLMPKMKGDEILNAARILAPDTQRLLIADTADLQTMVNAINLAGIHACLTLPFEDGDFINQVNLCCNQYETGQHQKSLKRIIQRQNRQLFLIASNFKKKEALYSNQIEKKKKEIRILESRVRATGRSAYPDKPVLLKTLLEKRNIAFSQDSFCTAFLTLQNQIKKIIESAAAGRQIALQPVSYPVDMDQALSDNKYAHLIETLLPLLYCLLDKKKRSDSRSHEKVKEIILDDHFELILSKDKIQAAIKIKTIDTDSLSLAYVKQFLEKNKIINGVKQDHEIEAWLHKSGPNDTPFVIARGREPKYPQNAEIRYHFPTQFLHAGKVNKDGSINFTDRGEIPFVNEDAFLAAKIFPEPGVNGADVHGRQIIVADPTDLTFSSGPGTRMSEDGVRIYATTSGQPYLDAMGNISVCAEFQLKGDLGFETGDVTFDGNVIVNGTIKQGFKVRCASLTAKEIQGAEIDIQGDLNVSLGIIDAELVNVKGSVQAKFVRNSKINAFGDLIVQKEIIDSKINLSGACINETGSIINSEISAKMGIRAGSIGNKSSSPSTLTVGVDEHTNLLVAKVDSKMTMNKRMSDELAAEINLLEKEDQSLHAVISQHAYVQDRSQLELNDIEKKMENLKASGNMAAFQKVSRTIKELKKNAREAEKGINTGFERQDQIALEISHKKGRIKKLQDLNADLSDKKTRLIEFSNRNKPLSEVRVAKTIESRTWIFAANSSLNLSTTSARCCIREVTKSSDNTAGIPFYEMQLGAY